MKKLLTCLLAICLCIGMLSVLAGCGNTQQGNSTETTQEPTQEVTQEPTQEPTQESTSDMKFEINFDDLLPKN